jgi:hypothetical protein
VFGVSQLKTFLPDHTPVYTELPTSFRLDVIDLDPKHILFQTLVKKANVGVDQLVDGTDLQFGNTMKCCVGAIPTHQLGDKLYLKWVECLECHQVHQANKWRKATMCLRALKE